MKEFLIVFIVLLLVFIPNILFKNYLQTTGDELIKILNNMNDDISNGRNINEEKSSSLRECFREKEKGWILIIDHDILDEIENGIEECISSYDEEDKMEFTSSYGKLKNAIEDLTKREEVSLRNIL